MAAAVSRWSRVLSGLGAIVCGQLLRGAGQLLLVPLYLHCWPTARYGEWLVLTSAAAYLASFDLGVNAAGTNRLTQDYARGDLAAYRRYQHSAMLFYVAIATLGTIAVSWVAWRTEFAGWLGLEALPRRESAWVLQLVGMQFLWTLPVGFLANAYRTTGDLARSEWVGNLRGLGMLVAAAGVLLLGGGPVGVAAAQLGVLFASAVLVFADVRRRLPELAPALSGARLSAWIDLLGPSSMFLAIVLGAGIAMQGSVLVVGALLGSVAVAIFVTTRTLANSVRQGVYTLTHAVWPQITALEAVGDGSLRKIHRILVSLCVVMSVAGTAVLWHGGGWIVRAWTVGRVDPEPFLLHALLLQVVLQVPWLASSIVPVASNRHRLVARAYLLGGILGLAAGALLVPHLGLAGIPVGFILGEASTCWVAVPRHTCIMLGDSVTSFLGRQLALMAGAVAAVFPIAAIAVGPEDATGLLRLALAAALVVPVSLAIGWVGLRHEERRFLLDRWAIAKRAPGAVHASGVPERRPA